MAIQPACYPPPQRLILEAEPEAGIPVEVIYLGHASKRRDLREAGPLETCFSLVLLGALG